MKPMFNHQLLFFIINWHGYILHKSTIPLKNVIIDKTKLLLPPALCPVVDEEDK